MKPYYEHAGIQIFHGDCREIAPLVAYKCEALISDPPYGINYVHGAEKIPNASRLNEIPVYGDSTPFNPWPWVNYPRVVLFGANHYAPKLPPSPHMDSLG